jgi:hypothetical protein
MAANDPTFMRRGHRERGVPRILNDGHFVLNLWWGGHIKSCGNRLDLVNTACLRPHFEGVDEEIRLRDDGSPPRIDGTASIKGLPQPLLGIRRHRHRGSGSRLTQVTHPSEGAEPAVNNVVSGDIGKVLPSQAPKRGERGIDGNGEDEPL